ncbi:uncharacterized protein SETTUDRAFT_163649 [Exserohilum turcica Et28A]|uniref:Uncharacterized protein n=1 Tax=Exserohilum turcicum (strain 28A) TaxID=671987 RepID=R0IIR2_EXST2|nr:uncharacterized protein SETTUDRAFT_163649 [Exserohilum turcica Et28A]EOA84831.1 hypothetical protein SETTUDRAFT_163649 [Exserohilum turcica Et28A]
MQAVFFCHCNHHHHHHLSPLFPPLARCQRAANTLRAAASPAGNPLFPRCQSRRLLAAASTAPPLLPCRGATPTTRRQKHASNAAHACTGKLE